MSGCLTLEDIEYLNKHFKNSISPKRKTTSFFQGLDNHIYREYEKKNDIFIATEKYYISDNNEYIGFNFSKEYSYKGVNCLKNIYLPYLTNFFERIVPSDNHLFVSVEANRTYNEDNSSFINHKYVDLVLIRDISFSLDETEINKKDILRKIFENDMGFQDKLLEKLYYTHDFSHKISVSLPDKYGKKLLDNIDVNNKFLFRINFTELPLNYNEEML